MTARSVEIRIGGRPPTPNARRHWIVVAKDNDHWKSAAKLEAMRQRPDDFGPPIQHAEIEVTFVVPDERHRDWDNAIGSQKPLLDGLVEAGLLADDSTRVIHRISFPPMRLERGQAATIYRITEVEMPSLGLA